MKKSTLGLLGALGIMAGICGCSDSRTRKAVRIWAEEYESPIEKQIGDIGGGYVGLLETKSFAEHFTEAGIPLKSVYERFDKNRDKILNPNETVELEMKAIQFKITRAVRHFKGKNRTPQ